MVEKRITKGSTKGSSVTFNRERYQLQTERDKTRNTRAGLSFLSQRKSAIDRWK